VPIHWDDIEILQVLDEAESTGNAAALMNGTALMQAVAARRNEIPTPQEYRSFIHELEIAQDAGLLTFEDARYPNIAPPDPDTDPNDWLQRTFRFALTIAGRDRARGRVVQVPLPDPAEDDGRLIRGSTLEDVAHAIGDAYYGVQLRRFLAESGIADQHLPEFAGESKWQYVAGVLETLATGGHAQRRELRQFLGAWLDGHLHTGPEPELRDKIVKGLGRQGWHVRDGCVVAGERTLDRPSADRAVGRDARLRALHPRILAVSGGLFEQEHRAAAILEAFKAVNNRVKEMSGLAADGVDLMARAFRPERPLLRVADLSTETGRNVQTGYHRMFMGAMPAFRNPHAHEQFAPVDEDEALEELGLASLMMRRLDEIATRDASGG